MQVRAPWLVVLAYTKTRRAVRGAPALVDASMDAGGVMSAPAAYDLNAVFDALQGLYNGLATGETMEGRAQHLTAYSEVEGNVQTPAMILELDDIAWDQTMGGGQDVITIMATILVQNVETKDAQRQLRSFLSRAPGAGMARIKAILAEDDTLGGLVSYVQMGQARQMGKITFDNVDYLGVALPLEVVS